MCTDTCRYRLQKKKRKKKVSVKVETDDLITNGNLKTSPDLQRWQMWQEVIPHKETHENPVVHGSLQTHTQKRSHFSVQDRCTTSTEQQLWRDLLLFSQHDDWSQRNLFHNCHVLFKVCRMHAVNR